MPIAFELNDRAVSIEVDPAARLLYVLRNDLGLRGPRFGCGLGQCGACTVHIDGVAVRSCITPLSTVDVNKKIVTLEGLGTPEKPHRVQKAFIDEQAAQCGYCTPGILVTAKALLAETPVPTRDEIRHALAGNLCRCTGYTKILDAVELAALRMKGARA